MADFILGMNAKAYVETSSTGLANLTEMSNVTNVQLSLSAGEADVTTRANSGWRATAATLREATATFDMVWKTDDAGFSAIKTAFLTSDTLEMAFLTGAVAVADSEGPYGTWSITGFDEGQPLEEAITVSVTCKLATFTEWVTEGVS